ncbi:MAG: hypothetical protein V4645_12620 [Pseudomonadota bacterium]|jgi:hypothetical protein
MATLVEQLAAFTQVPYADLPPAVVAESKRLLLDSIGAALAATDSPKGRIGIDYGGLQGAECSPSPDPSTAMTDAELIAKFRDNAEGRLAAGQADALANAVFGLEAVRDFGTLMALTVPA